jgi:hypothetical protein
MFADPFMRTAEATDIESISVHLAAGNRYGSVAGVGKQVNAHHHDYGFVM